MKPGSVFQHDGLPPQNYKEKNQLKQMIREGNDDRM